MNERRSQDRDLLERLSSEADSAGMQARFRRMLAVERRRTARRRDFLRMVAVLGIVGFGLAAWILIRQVADPAGLPAVATLRLEPGSPFHRIDGMRNAVPEAILERLSHDPDVNVRLAALDALLRQAPDRDLARALVESVPLQPTPIVQAHLIHGLTRHGVLDQAARDHLRGHPRLHDASRALLAQEGAS